MKVLINGQILIYYNELNFIYFKNGCIFSIVEGRRYRIVSIEKNIITRLISKSRLISRLMRLNPRAIMSLSAHEMLISYRGKIYNVDVLTCKATIEHSFRSGMRNPLYFTDIRDHTDNKVILYGEYFANLNKDDVKIYKRINGEWSVAYTFRSNEIQHIHNIIFDCFSSKLYILTGDSNHESAIWESDINFTHMNRILYGSQKFRSCFLIPDRSGFNYTTDTPLEKNFFIQVINNKKSEYIINDFIEIPGPVIFGIFVPNKSFVFSTSVEPDSNITGIRYLLTKKLGDGVIDNFSYLYYGEKDSTIQQVLRLEKDWLPAGLFQFGTIQIIDVKDEIIAFCIGVKKYDGKTIKIEI